MVVHFLPNILLVNGSFSQWTSWNSCPVCSDPLNGRHHLRYRTCLDPPPMYDGLSCSGEYVDKMPCDDLPINETCPGQFSLFFLLQYAEVTFEREAEKVTALGYNWILG